jgi:hypothetical protein
MASIAIVVGGIVFILVVIAILRWGKLPPFTHRDMLALIALLGTIGGAMILTFLKWIQTDRFNAQSDRLVVELTKPHPNGIAQQVGDALSTITGALAWNLKLDSVGIIVVLLSLGLVISARTIKAKALGSELEMGTTDDALRVHVTNAPDDPVPATLQPPPDEPLPTEVPADTPDVAPTAR